MTTMLMCGRCVGTGRESGYPCTACGGSRRQICSGGEPVVEDERGMHTLVTWHQGTSEETRRCYLCGEAWPCEAARIAWNEDR
ncbi:MAG: hypothetical protein ACTHMP_05310 [Thermomicrobiales bacterium]